MVFQAAEALPKLYDTSNELRFQFCFNLTARRHCACRATHPFARGTGYPVRLRM
ncbi:hypothetical protein RC1_3401 [Rhodospirillum centenum SW]|uniref:Uncharacterized protein n=1 Tax=Rhodospirillum centenum (strain ATCC 51521 / SW) TaxID=414684 RepID=B6IWT7_RHOCS|nr:hypothetical protein RC1_3401 [Rhodospirillum centenum SW]